MRKMDHANIIRMYEVFENENELFIVMEVCAGGELFDRIKEQPDGNYSENDAAEVLRQICEGLKYMHGHKYDHTQHTYTPHHTTARHTHNNNSDRRNNSDSVVLSLSPFSPSLCVCSGLPIAI